MTTMHQREGGSPPAACSIPDPAAHLEARVAALSQSGQHAAAARAVIEGLGQPVLGYLRALLKDPAAADDAYSIWAENVWKGMASWRRASSVRAWSYRVAWNAASRLHRDPWRRRRADLPAGLASRRALLVRSSLRRTIDRQAEALALVRASLTQEEETLILLRYDRGLAWAEVAEVLAAEGEALDLPALRKRFERLKSKIVRIARERGLLPLD